MFHCVNEDWLGKKRHCAQHNLPQCDYCRLNPPSPEISEERRLHLDREDDEIDLLDPIQNNCKYGYVLPDRCRYNSITGCACGAYPPLYPRVVENPLGKDAGSSAPETTD